MADDKKGGILLLLGAIALFIAVLILAGYFLVRQYTADSQNQNQTQGNNQQEVVPIPIDPTASWSEVKNSELGFSFKYPNNFFDTGHEPNISTTACVYENFSGQCPNIAAIVPSYAGLQNIPAQKIRLNGIDYCSYQATEGAAGHIYYTDYYLAVKNQVCAIVILETSQTNCSNYLSSDAGNPQEVKNYNDCVAKNQNQPIMIDQIINTFTFTKQSYGL